MVMLTGLVVVKISQCIRKSGHKIVHLKYVQVLMVSYTLIKLEGNDI